MKETINTVKIYYEFRNSKIQNTTIEFENINLEEGTFKFTICSEYINKGKREKVKYKEICNNTEFIKNFVRRLEPSFEKIELANEKDSLNNDILYAIRINGCKKSNYYDEFLKTLETDTNLSSLRDLKINEYTKEKIHEFFQ